MVSFGILTAQTLHSPYISHSIVWLCIYTWPVQNMLSATLIALQSCHAHQGPTRPNFTAIARQHCVNRQTLLRHYDRAIQPMQQAEDHRSLLTRDQEDVILEHLEQLGKRHLFITPIILRNIVAEITQHRLCDSWARQFVKKHQDQVNVWWLGAWRPAVTQQSIGQYLRSTLTW